MAIIRTGPIVQGISGSLGGLIFATGRTTQTARTRPKHRSSTTDKALAARARVTTQMLAWRSISTTDKLAWRNAANQFQFTDSLGQRRNLTPFQLFVKMRSYTTTFGPKPAIPFGPVTSSLLTLSLTTSITTYGIRAHMTYRAAETADVLIYGRRSFHDYPTRPTKPYKFLSATAAQPASVTLLTDWFATFGNLVRNEYVEVLAFTMADGRFPSMALTAGTIVSL